MNRPIVSVIVPHFNRGAMMVDTLETVVSQSFTDWELIVVDDASDENPTALVRTVVPDAQVIVLERNGGPSRARNVGTAAAKGRFVAFLDSDDLWRGDKLAAQVTAALARPEPDRVVAYTACVVLGATGPVTQVPERGWRVGEDPGEYLFLNGGFVQTSSLFVARALLQEARFSTELQMYEDFLIFLELMAARADYLWLDRPLTYWRNDQRADRLSARSSNVVRNGRVFVRLAAPLMSRHASIAFQVRTMGLEYLKHRPFSMLASMAQGLAAGVISLRYVAWLIVCRVIGPARYERMRGRTGVMMFGVEEKT